MFVEIVEALVFMNILLITIPPMIVYLFFNRQIVAGMTAGAVRGRKLWTRVRFGSGHDDVRAHPNVCS